MYHAKSCAASRSQSALSAAVLAALAAPAAAHTPPWADPNEETAGTSSMIAQPRRQTGTAVSVIDFADIELRGYTDLADVLRTQTAIGVSNSGGPGKSTVVRIRGEEAYRTLLICPQALPRDACRARAARLLGRGGRPARRRAHLRRAARHVQPEHFEDRRGERHVGLGSRARRRLSPQDGP